MSSAPPSAQRKKVDERVRTLIANGVHARHRSFFVMIGDHGKEQVANLHYVLTKSQIRARPSVLWCYSKELGFSTCVVLFFVAPLACRAPLHAQPTLDHVAGTARSA